MIKDIKFDLSRANNQSSEENEIINCLDKWKIK